MKNPTLQGWLAIAGALAAAILAIIVAVSDKTVTAEEANDISAKTNVLIETIQTETAE